MQRPAAVRPISGPVPAAMDWPWQCSASICRAGRERNTGCLPYTGWLRLQGVPVRAAQGIGGCCQVGHRWCRRLGWVMGDMMFHWKGGSLVKAIG